MEYHTSSLVSHNGRTVGSKANKKPETGTILTLVKDGVKVTVSLSKYLEGAL